jgi:hypothetical protein
MSGYPNVSQKWCPPGGLAAAGRQGCIDFNFPGSLNGILGRGSTNPAARAYVGPTGLGQPQVQTNLRWNQRSSSNAMDRRRLRKASNNIGYVPGWSTIGFNSSPLFVPTFLNGYWANNNITLRTISSNTLTPFRAMMNAGDPAMSYNSTILGSAGAYSGFLDPLYTRAHNQVSSTRRASNAGWRGLAGGVHQGGQSLWVGNQKFVYDSSDYVTFKKLQAKNRSYNDPTFGGDQHRASQVPLARVRH